MLFVKKKLLIQYLNGYIYIKWYRDKKFENRKNLKTEKGITCKISLNGHANKGTCKKHAKIAFRKKLKTEKGIICKISL